MADFYIGEIRAFACSYAPQGWVLCDGRSLPIAQNQALYSLLSNQFGGNQTNFNIPDLRGRTPIGYGVSTSGTTYNVGNAGGAETVALTTNQIPAHNHQFLVQNAPETGALASGTLAIPAAVNIYNPSSTTTSTLAPQSIVNTGGGGGHENMQPFTALNFCIAVTGYYPSRN